MRRWITALLVVAIVGGLGYAGYRWAMRPVVPTFADDADHFAYGSIGNDGTTGVPFAIWAVLPEVFSDLLPGEGYGSLGIVYAPDGPEDHPVGFSRARVGVDRMAINCAFCHVVRTREDPDAEPGIHLGGAANTVDLLAYQRFLAATAADPRFTPQHLLPAMAERGVPWLERQLHRFLLIRMTRQALLEEGRAFAWTFERPEWGPGRIDPFNPVKLGMLGLDDDGTIGNARMQAIWGVDRREAIRPDGPWHWDGLNTSLAEVILSSALGDGATAAELRFESLARIERYLRATDAPPSPHRPDPEAVARGEAIFAQHCAECHGADGERVLTVIPVEEIGTDAHRVAMWTDAARDAYNGYREGYDWGFEQFRNVEGYLARPHDGIWLGGPYLHNGSVPSLRDLLEPPERRPPAFLVGGDLLDGEKGGFVAPACDPADPPPRAEGFCYDTSLPGNANQGHLHGTDLEPGEKDDLVAYLLTL
jgi:hypothetical protein